MTRPVFLVAVVLCLLPLMVEMKNTFICERVVNITNPDGTTGQRCSGWVRLTSSPQQNVPGHNQRPPSHQRPPHTTPTVRPQANSRPQVTATTTTRRPTTQNNQRPPPPPSAGPGSGNKDNQIGVFNPDTIGNQPVKVNPVFIIDVPVNCEPGFQPDPNGQCRQTW